MTNQSTTKSEEDKTSYSLTTSASAASARPYCMLMELSTEEARVHPKEGLDQKREIHQRRISAEGLMDRVDAGSRKKTVTTNTPAKGVERKDMRRCPAMGKNISGVSKGMRLEYLCYNIWD